MMADSAGSLDVDLEAQQPSATPAPDDDEEREIRVFMSLLLESEPTDSRSDFRAQSPAWPDIEAQTEQPNQPQEPQPEPVGDFDENSSALWTLYEKEARAHDEALIKTWKEDMDGILIFAGLFSAALTSFIAESNETLQVDPMQEMVYYQRQSVAMLAQLSQQVASIAPQVSIPTTPLPPFPTFQPSPSDVRVNVYYFMSLVFSLSARSSPRSSNSGSGTTCTSSSDTATP
ncbi:hypothetical protein BC834DRAFT_988755 [Gloeopeniophorella convolvens]|nr:hypothetical protein BC834DRAFT_988755 [Gloeopeniophorella convolvens]